jgi:protein TonB
MNIRLSVLISVLIHTIIFSASVAIRVEKEAEEYEFMFVDMVALADNSPIAIQSISEHSDMTLSEANQNDKVQLAMSLSEVNHFDKTYFETELSDFNLPNKVNLDARITDIQLPESVKPETLFPQMNQSENVKPEQILSETTMSEAIKPNIKEEIHQVDKVKPKEKNFNTVKETSKKIKAKEKTKSEVKRKEQKTAKKIYPKKVKTEPIKQVAQQEPMKKNDATETPKLRANASPLHDNNQRQVHAAATLPGQSSIQSGQSVQRSGTKSGLSASSVVSSRPGAHGPVAFSSPQKNSGINKNARQTASLQKKQPISTGPIDARFGSLEGPQFLRRVLPSYPWEAKRRGVEGIVVLRLFIDERGALNNIAVLQDPGAGLAEAAIAALRQSSFRPAKRNGQPVASRCKLPIKFVLTR